MTNQAKFGMGRVALTVNDLDTVGGWYEKAVGLAPIARDGETATYGAGERVLLELRQDRNARRRSPREAGLFHTAFLMPRRGALGSWTKYIAENRIPVVGASDHNVSEALYLTDPEGNGVEVYADRPRDSWQWSDGTVTMGTEALDVMDLINAADIGPWSGAPNGTTVGHVHLQVGAQAPAETFYHGLLGLDITTHYPGATFYSAEGYHHHIATNQWNSRGAGMRSFPSTGLSEVEILLDAARAETIRAKAGSLELADPWGTPVALRLAALTPKGKTMLVDGKWTENWQPVQATDAKGGFVRQISGFRNWITPDGAAGPTGEGGFKAEAGRYHLYVALICPWASRTLIGRKLKGLSDLISVTVTEPETTDQGWRFGTPDPINGAEYMHQIYTKADPHYTGRATVPVLWDKERGTIVNNESADILRMLNTGFGDLASGPDLYPEALRPEIDALNDRIYPRLNNGVYRAGFATTQVAYEEAFRDVFAQLQELEDRLSDGRRFLFGDALTETDVRLFVTLVRFDAAYYGLFKTNLHRIAEYPALQGYLMRVLDVPGVRDTVSIDHIKRGYYSIKALNPTRIVPVGPDLPGLDPKEI